MDAYRPLTRSRDRNRKPDTGGHVCHAVGCQVPVMPRMLMCRTHWAAVPPDLQRDVWRTYREGQEVTKDPTTDYIIAARKAVYAVAVAERRMSAVEAQTRLIGLRAILNDS